MPLDAAQHGIDLVIGKAVACMFGQQGHDFLQRVAPAGLAPWLAQVTAAKQVVDDFLRHLVGKIDQVGRFGRDGALRHHVELGRVRILHQRQAAGLLDRLQSQRAVAAHAGKHRADRQFPQLGRQAFKEGIDRQAVAAQLHRLAELEAAIGQAQFGVRWNNVNMIGPQFALVRDFHHRHAGGALQQFGQHGLVRRVQVLDHHIGNAAFLRDIGQEGNDGIEAACRRTDRHHREGDRCHFGWCGIAVFAACHRLQEVRHGKAPQRKISNLAF